jgi:hypothetical protein
MEKKNDLVNGTWVSAGGLLQMVHSSASSFTSLLHFESVRNSAPLFFFFGDVYLIAKINLCGKIFLPLEGKLQDIIKRLWRLVVLWQNPVKCLNNCIETFLKKKKKKKSISMTNIFELESLNKV